MSADRAIKEPCRVATTANITLSGLQTIDGVSVGAGDRVLVHAQTSAVNNGIYDAASGSWTRSTDFDGVGEVIGGTLVSVTSGDSYAGSAHRVAGSGAITIGSSAIQFTLLDDAISLADFGYVADDSTDDTAAWQAAIAAAAALNIRTIQVPYGKTGVSVVSGQIVNGTLPSGLTFEGVGCDADSDYEIGTRLKYTGSSTCWFINFPTYLGERGRWIWRNLAFQAMEPEATMFDFNDTVYNAAHPPLPNDESYSYLSHVRFESCYFIGAGTREDQTGDAIRGTKMFQLTIDENCYIRGWRRGIWLVGCDNSVLLPRAYLNARNLMIESSGSFGNDNLIYARYFGGVFGEASEDAYPFWDSGTCSTYIGALLEDGGEHAGVALFYLNGYGTTIIGPDFGSVGDDIKWFHLGPKARDAMILHPRARSANLNWAPIIDNADSNDFGYSQEAYRLTVVNPNKDFRFVVGAHPRIAYQSAIDATDCPVDQNREMLADAAGYRPRSRLFNALNNWAQNGGTEANSGITSFVEDANASGGWACRLDKDTVQSGINLRYVLGVDVMPGDLVQVAIRQKTTSTSGFVFVTLKNNVYHSPLALTSNTGGVYLTDISTVDLSGWAAGDVLRVEIYRAGAGNSSVDVDYIETRAVESAISNLSIAAVTGVNGTGNNAAKKTDVDAAFAAIVTKFNALRDVLKARGDLA